RRHTRCDRDWSSDVCSSDLNLSEAARAEAERLLLAREVDLAITLVEKKSRAGIQVRPLLELPLILLVHRNSGLARAGELWKRDKIGRASGRVAGNGAGCGRC